ncbi:hypothetical protein ACIBTV_24210 [Micromonospora sp. NPDC049366]|uniref:hypothetical protein n=1 Tax=Micromonospora sp. NPDC049366 TaxID=3364271 RepID=UPI0037B8CF7E
MPNVASMARGARATEELPQHLGGGDTLDADVGTEQHTVAPGEVDGEVEDDPIDGLAYEGDVIVGHETMPPPSAGRQLLGQPIGHPYRDLGGCRSHRHREITAPEAPVAAQAAPRPNRLRAALWLYNQRRPRLGPQRRSRVSDVDHVRPG